MISTEIRDSDIHTLAEVNITLSQFRELSFLVTGSYAIEALTQTPINHQDMDANVLATVLPVAKTTALTSLSSSQRLQLYKQTPDRLEYDVFTTGQSSKPRRLEIHFTETAPLSQATQPGTFTLKDSNPKISQVSLVDASLRDSAGADHVFKVKSLAYSLATWAIRISGAAQNQLRQVRDSDLELFQLLLSQNFSSQDVYSAIEHHPQMPENLMPEEIFQAAQDILKRNEA